ncbi:MADF domain [Cinara cedri]|uniref:MADF domain n=1 Tax=Cinara cedri TaxID=506608 RepID=A0A5E4M138_9HEMI|nr:MADF domain [Cinara cedri]
MEELIKKVREHGVLYDHGSHDYRDQHVRQTAWEEIGRELQISGNEAKLRWNKLRRCYCNARNRRRVDTKSGIASKKKNYWKYEKQMSFILPFLENRKTHENLNESQASLGLVTEQGDLAEKFGEEIDLQSPSDEFSHMDVEIERNADANSDAIEKTTSNDAKSVKKHYKAIKRNKKQKCITDSPVKQMVDILKDSSALRKRRFEEKSVRPEISKTVPLQNMDDTDMFFLSMSKMTKQLPKVEQARIKLALSNSVLSAEVKCNEQSYFAPHYSCFTQQQSVPSTSPASSTIQSLKSPSDYSSG